MYPEKLMLQKFLLVVSMGEIFNDLASPSSILLRIKIIVFSTVR